MIMIIKYLSFLAIVIFGFFTIILFVKKSTTNKRNRLLACFFLATTISSSFLFYLYIAFDEHSTIMLQYYFPLDICLLTLMGPFLYFHMQQCFGQRKKERTVQHYSHFLTAIPSAMYLGYFMRFPVQQRIAILQQNYIHESWQLQIIKAIFIIQILLYFVACTVILKKTERKNRIISMGIIKIDIWWLQNYFIVNIALIIVAIPIYMVYNNDNIYSILLLMTVIIESILLLSKALWQINIYEEEKESDDELEIPFRNTNRTIKHITNENADKWIDQLTQTIEKHKLYLKADCTINDISKASELPRHIISKIINNRLQMKFPDFINAFRIKIAKEILVDKEFQDLTFESIALKCGFGSKSNFNKKFKKFTNTTPTQYKRRNVK